MKSQTLPMYSEWTKTATAKQIEFVDAVFAMCETNYEAGGDAIVECYTPAEVLADFTTLDQVREECGSHVEQELNARWGEDSDPQLKRAEKFDAWNAQ